MDEQHKLDHVLEEYVDVLKPDPDVLKLSINTGEHEPILTGYLLGGRMK